MGVNASTGLGSADHHSLRDMKLMTGQPRILIGSHCFRLIKHFTAVIRGVLREVHPSCCLLSWTIHDWWFKGREDGSGWCLSHFTTAVVSFPYGPSRMALAYVSSSGVSRRVPRAHEPVQSGKLGTSPRGYLFQCLLRIKNCDSVLWYGGQIRYIFVGFRQL